jgi:DNA-binding NtrC family response regulator
LKSSSARSLLLIDDDIDLLKAYVEILREEGFDAKGITDAKEGIAFLQKGPLPTVLLVDCRMPQMDGKVFLKLLSDRIPDIASRTRIYGFSALGQGSELSKELEPYVRRILEKPDDIIEFVELIRNVFDESAA